MIENKIENIAKVRKDEYGLNFYVQENKEINVITPIDGQIIYKTITAQIEQNFIDNVIEFKIKIVSTEDVKLTRFGLRLGIDCYMVRFPDWNNKFFPSAMRCENDCFWGCFMSPNGEMIGVCSPDKITSFKYEYNGSKNEVGHRIYTTSLEFFNALKLPNRHFHNKIILANQTYEYRIYLKKVEDKKALFDFIKEKANLTIFNLEKHTIEKNEKIIINNFHSDYNLSAEKDVLSEKNSIKVVNNSDNNVSFTKNKVNFEKGNVDIKQSNKDDLFSTKQKTNLTIDDNNCSLEFGRYTLSAKNASEVNVYVRKDWFYYLTCAKNSAEICQQKIGTHTESWYGYFSLIAYAKVANDKINTEKLKQKFDAFFISTTKGFYKKKLKARALPHRLQNCSGMISLLADMYELTRDIKYLNYANDFANWLIKLQSKDGSYRSHGTHYTCVIYPAKSMLELAIVEKKAGLLERYNSHFSSAYKAIENLNKLMDNIETEGEMTFEDGMISCEALQLGYLAVLTDNAVDKAKFAKSAEIILQKHKCLEQHLIPDCRTKGATYRYWEGRYDINMNVNFMNTPHGWTSWKTYATYYLYILTGKIEYLKDTMDTIGASMQMIDANGILNWSFVFDPCVEVKRMVKAKNELGLEFVETVIGEEYVEMVSDWYRQPENRLTYQYFMSLNKIDKKKRDFGGSCDNDVHEHFKCLDETVFGKAFLHNLGESWLTYNCRRVNSQERSNNTFVSEDKYVKQLIVYSLKVMKIMFNGIEYNVSIGINIIFVVLPL